MILTNIAKSAGNHDRLVIAADTAGSHGLESTEIAGQVRSPELIVECSSAQRPIGHDLQRSDDSIGLTVAGLPGSLVTWNIEV